MGKTLAEPTFGKALREMDLASIVYKPPDDARNWKPCDYMVWWRGAVWGAGDAPVADVAYSAWFEVKDIDLVSVFPKSQLRPSQLLGIRDAGRVGIPYYLAIWWRKASMWSISDAAAVVAWFTDNPEATAIKRDLLQSRFGVDATNGQLSSIVRALILEGY